MNEKHSNFALNDEQLEQMATRGKFLYENTDKAILGWDVASDDAGTQRSPLIRPELFEEMIQPHYNINFS